MRFAILVFSLALFASACGPFAVTDPAGTRGGFDPLNTGKATCTVTEKAKGEFTMTCPDGTAVSWTDGRDGADGEKGADGNDGANGQNGQDGQPGQDGKDGSSCSVVDNQDTTLSMVCTNGTAVTWSTEGGVMPTRLLGSVTLNNSLDVAFVSGVTEITGNLTVAFGRGVTHVALPALQRIGNTFSLNGNVDLQGVSLPALEFVDKVSLHQNSALQTFALAVANPLSALNLEWNGALVSYSAPTTWVTGTVWIVGNAALEEFAAPLTWVGGYLTLIGNNSLTEFSVPEFIGMNLTVEDNAALAVVTGALLRAHDISFEDNPSLRAVTLPVTYVTDRVNFIQSPSLEAISLSAITDAGELNIYDNDALVSLTLGLTRVRGAIGVSGNAMLPSFSAPLETVEGDVSFWTNAGMTSISLPALLQVGGDFTVAFHAALEVLSMDALAQVDTLQIAGNSSLTEIHASSLTTAAELGIGNNASLCNDIALAIAAQLTGAVVNIDANDGACPP